MAGPRNPSEADTVVGGREASTCRCDASWPRQANWVKITPSAPAISNCSQELSRRINPGHRTTQRGQQTSEFNGKRRPRRKVVDRPSRGLGRHQPVRKRLPQIIDRCESEGVTNTLDVWEICWGDPDLEWLAQSSVDVFGYATTHRMQRLWRRLTPTARSADRAGHASSRPPASQPVRSWDNASSGACEIRAAIAPPRSGKSGLYAPRRGHDQGRARGRFATRCARPAGQACRVSFWSGSQCLSVTARGRPGRVHIQPGGARVRSPPIAACPCRH
jgi:hypothetical protein